MLLAEPPQSDRIAATESPAMEPFRRLVRDATSAMEMRNLLLSQPDEFFRKIFDGRLPTLHEKLLWIEERVRESATWLTFQNDLYLVIIEMTSPLIHACIRRHDGKPCTDWNHLQQIKSELIGPEHEAVELFPAESRLVNTSNEYHLWAHPTSGYRFPFGFDFHRCVLSQQTRTDAASRTSAEESGRRLQVA